MTSYLFMALLLLTLSKDLAASVVVALRGKDQIIVAADGKGLTKSLAGAALNQTSAETCKIFAVQNTVVALVGLRGDLSGFQATDVILPLVSSGGTLRQVADRIITALTKPVQDALVRKPDGQYLGSLFHDGDLAISVLLARFDSGAATLSIRDLMFSEIKPNSVLFKIRSTDCPGNCPPGAPGVFLVGTGDASDEYLAKHHISTKWVREASSAVDLLTLESARHPETIGPPFSVVTLNRDKLNWNRNGACTP